MSSPRERSFTEIYANDPERADALIFSRRSGPSRRGFLGGAGLAAMGAALGGVIPFARNMPAGLIPAAFAQTPAAPVKLDFPGKDSGLVVLGERPLVAETPEALLDADTTPTNRFFIRNNGQIPDPVTAPDAWSFKIDGEVNTPLELKLGDLKQRFQPKTYRMVLECGGNGRSLLRAHRARQPVDQWRRRLRGMDRRAVEGRARRRRAEAQRKIHRPLRRGRASVR